MLYYALRTIDHLASEGRDSVRSVNEQKDLWFDPTKRNQVELDTESHGTMGCCWFLCLWF